MFKHYEFRNDIEALELAVRRETTSNPDYGQGNGLAGAIAIAQHNDGLFAITFGQGRLRILDANVEPKRHFPPLNGTCVEMQFSTDTDIDLPKALWGHEPSSYLEMKFEDVDGEESVFSLRDYAPSFGNRITSGKIKTLILNLIRHSGGKAVRVQMDDVSIVSSSFVDELFGKLFVKLGALEFARLVKVEAANPVYRNIIDQAILQRVGQSIPASEYRPTHHFNQSRVRRDTRDEQKWSQLST